MSQILHKAGGDQILEKLDDTYSIMNWEGFKVITGMEKGPFFFNEIEERRHYNRSNMIVVTGSPGEGKSYFALRLAEIFDKKFDVKLQVVFERIQLLKLITEGSPLKRGQVIMVDEAQFVAGSRRWYEEFQKDIMEHLEAVRSKGLIIIIIALHLDLLDKIIRKYVLTFMAHVEKRGTGIIYRLYTPRFETNMFRHRLGKVTVSLPDAEKCSHSDCLRCKYNDTCLTDRAVYERLKEEFLAKKANESIESIKKKDIAKIKVEDTLKSLREKALLKFEYTNRGTISPESIQRLALSELGLDLPFNKCMAIQKLNTSIYGKRV